MFDQFICQGNEDRILDVDDALQQGIVGSSEIVFNKESESEKIVSFESRSKRLQV